MNLLLFHLLPVTAVVLYGGASFCYLRLLSGSSSNVRRARLALGSGALFHLGFIVLAVSGGRIEPAYSTMLSIVCLIAVAAALFLEIFWKAALLGAFVAPLALAASAFSGILFHLPVRERELPSASAGLLVAHITLATLAYASLLIAFVLGLALILQERLIKGGRVPLYGPKLPPVAVLDRLNTRFIVAGFLLMLLAISSGWVTVSGESLGFHLNDARVVASLATVVLYAAVLAARRFYGWRGERLAVLSSLAFCTLILSSVGVNFLSSSFHVF